MFAPFKKLIFTFFLMTLSIVVGIVGYVILENYSVLDAFYMTIVTISTVGFGEVNKLGDGGKAFAMFLIIGGWASSVHVLARIGQFLFDGGFFDILGE